MGWLGVAGANTQITINGQGSGRVFDGIGACSGGGGNSRLLIDYPDAQRKEILDYLFKPNFGASLSIFKVEIGGDGNSTDGSEPSTEPVKGKEDYHRGYEWWLMQQAKARNPDIKLSALAWGAPGWIGGGIFWSQDNIDYRVGWLQHAKSDYGLAIDYMGGWNEVGSNNRGYNKSATATWYINMKAALVAKGIATKLVAFDDNSWDNLQDILGNTDLLNSVDVIGVHYPSNGTSPASAQQSGKVLSASEWGSLNYNSGAGEAAQQINLGYINGKLTSYIFWPLICSVYSGMPYDGNGLMLAQTPWSGYYEVGKQIWVFAHTTQFAQPGWQYLDNACGFLGGSSNNGSYVTLKSPSGGDYSIIVETVSATGDQSFTFTPSADLKASSMHVWRTDLGSGNSADQFVKLSDPQATNGAYTLTLNKNCLYTFTTTTGQTKGSTTPPPAKSMAIPYYDSFDESTLNEEAPLFSDMNGAFILDSCYGGHKGGCLTQTVPAQPILWNNPPGNFSGVISIAGDRDWTDYQVQCDVMLQQAGAAQILGRMSSLDQQTTVPGYFLEISSTGSWRLFNRESNRNETSLASGTKTFALGSWHTLKMVFQGNNIEGWIDGVKVTTVSDGSYPKGNAGVGTNGWNMAQFDNFSITPPGSSVGLAAPTRSHSHPTTNLIMDPPEWLSPIVGPQGSRVDALGKIHVIQTPSTP
jgi:hypothetical protein